MTHTLYSMYIYITLTCFWSTFLYIFYRVNLSVWDAFYPAIRIYVSMFWCRFWSLYSSFHLLYSKFISCRCIPPSHMYLCFNVLMLIFKSTFLFFLYMVDLSVVDAFHPVTRIYVSMFWCWFWSPPLFIFYIVDLSSTQPLVSMIWFWFWSPHSTRGAVALLTLFTQSIFSCSNVQLYM